jgi:hypothetical protein
VQAPNASTKKAMEELESGHGKRFVQKYFFANHKKYQNGYLCGLIAIRHLLLDRSTTNPAQYAHPEATYLR